MESFDYILEISKVATKYNANIDILRKSIENMCECDKEFPHVSLIRAIDNHYIKFHKNETFQEYVLSLEKVYVRIRESIPDFSSLIRDDMDIFFVYLNIIEIIDDTDIKYIAEILRTSKTRYKDYAFYNLTKLLYKISTHQFYLFHQ